MDLEAATDRAIQYLQKAGHPVGLMELVNAEPGKDGGWNLRFRKTFRQEFIDLVVDQRGKVIALRRVSGDV